MKRKAGKLSKKIIALIVCGVIIGVILLSCLAIQIGFWVSCGIECWRPDYQKIELMPILNKQTLSDDDYDTLYKQTGLTKFGIDRALSRGAAGKNRILDIQNDFFTEHPVIHETFAPWTCMDRIEKNIAHTYLEKGDIVITSSTHFSSCRLGHAGLVTNEFGGVAQATEYGQLSSVGNINYYINRVNFIILRVKDEFADDKLRSDVVDFTIDNLLGLPYSGVAGVFTDKNSTKTTQCAHLVWYAYNQFGIDIDANGGLVVSPWNIANSDKLDVVQAFGFDITKDALWENLNY